MHAKPRYSWTHVRHHDNDDMFLKIELARLQVELDSPNSKHSVRKDQVPSQPDRICD